MNLAPAIETSQLTKIYDGEIVIHSVDFCATKGSVHAIVGPNGAGKTTLLKMMATLIKPTSGSIHVFGDRYENETVLRQHVHYISPEVNVYPFFQVKDILQYARLLYERWDPARSKVLVDAFSLPLSKTVRQLSLGMKMRLRVVLALSAQADVLLMDEATNGIDPAAKDQVLDLVLQEVANRDVTIVMATHHLAEIERAADTVSVLVGGRLVSTDNLDNLKEQVYEVRTLLPESSAQVIRTFPGVIDCANAGKTLTFVWTGRRHDIEALLSSSQASSVDIRPATLERWFQSKLRKEGVPSEKIVLPDSPSV